MTRRPPCRTRHPDDWPDGTPNDNVELAQLLRRDLQAHAQIGQEMARAQPDVWAHTMSETPTPRDDPRDDDDWQFVVRFRGHDYLVTVDAWTPDPQDDSQEPAGTGGPSLNLWPADVAARDTR